MRSRSRIKLVNEFKSEIEAKYPSSKPNSVLFVLFRKWDHNDWLGPQSWFSLRIIEFSYLRSKPRTLKNLGINILGVGCGLTKNMSVGHDFDLIVG